MQYIDLIYFPDASEFFPFHQVSGQCCQYVFHVVLYGLYHTNDVGTRRDVREETEYIWLVLAWQLLGWSLDTRAVHPSNETLSSTMVTTVKDK